MAKKVMYCEIPGCGAELSPGCGSKGGPMTCSRCSSCRYRWRKQGEEAIVARMQTLTFWQTRIEYIAPMIAKNIKRVNDQLAEIREENERTTAATLRHAKALQRKAVNRNGIH